MPVRLFATLFPTAFPADGTTPIERGIIQFNSEAGGTYTLLEWGASAVAPLGSSVLVRLRFDTGGGAAIASGSGRPVDPDDPTSGGTHSIGILSVLGTSELECHLLRGDGTPLTRRLELGRSPVIYDANSAYMISAESAYPVSVCAWMRVDVAPG